MIVKEIKIVDIEIYKNIRSEKKDVSGLMKSIENNGLQHPIVVYPKGDKYILAYGFRRLLALKKLGIETVPAVIIEEEFTEVGFLTKNAIENIHREDVNPIELGKVCSIFSEQGFSPSEISAKLHIPTTRVKMVTGLYRKLPSDYRDIIGFVQTGAKKKGKVSPAVAVAILSLNLTEKNTGELLEYARINELSTRDIHLIDKLAVSGMSYKSIIENLDRYCVRGVQLPLKIKELKKIEVDHGSLAQYVRDIITGVKPPNKDLLL